MRQRKTARVAARVFLSAQLKIADNVLIKQWVAVEFLEQVECDVRLVLFERLPDWGQIALQTDGLSLVAHALECRVDVELGLPELDLLLGITIQRVRRYQVLLDQD